MYSKFLVGSQFVLIGMIAVYCSLPALNWCVVAIFLLGFCIGVWAIITMQLSNLRVQPIPKKDAKLITTGIYSIIRHPMYTSVILMAASLVISKIDGISFFLFLLLLLTLLTKLYYEEHLLEEKFPEYSAYKTRTWRLIPYLFLIKTIFFYPLSAA